ncbi:MAG: hypothetical protein ABEJ84_00450 [Halodesulfurarchaeum sp.]
MKPSTAIRFLLIGLAVIAILGPNQAVVTTVTAKAPPEPVCGVCTGQIEEAAAARGVVLERGASTMHIRLWPNGTAEFLARVELTRGSDRLGNVSLRETIVRDVSYTLVEEREDLRTALVDGTLRVRYTSSDVAHSTLGVLQFDAFHTRDPPPFALGGEGSPYPGADELTLRAPPGFELHGIHGDFSNETTIRWRGESHEQYAGHIEEDLTLSFVPEPARFPTIRVGVATVVDRARSLISWVGS